MIPLQTPRSAVNPVRKLSGEHKQLAKCRRLPIMLGVTDIRNQFGMKALLVKKGIYIYDVTECPGLYEKGK